VFFHKKETIHTVKHEANHVFQLLLELGSDRELAVCNIGSSLSMWKMRASCSKTFAFEEFGTGDGGQTIETHTKNVDQTEATRVLYCCVAWGHIS